MKPVAALFSFAVLTACTNAPAEERSLTGYYVQQLSGEAALSSRFQVLQRSGAEALQIGFLERNLVGAALLEQRDGLYETWLSSDNTTMTFQGGMLHSTRGLGAGLLASELSEPLALVRGRQSGASERIMTFLDGNDVATPRTFRCLVENEGARTIELNTGPVQTRLMSEDCEGFDAKFRNLYWVDAQGRIVQSRQWTGAFLGSVSTRTVIQ